MRLTITNGFAQALSSYLYKVKAITPQLEGKTENKALSGAPCLFSLVGPEVLRLPQACREVEVLSGIAWVTSAGQDLILAQGEKALVSKDSDTIISALGSEPLLLAA
ncbi:hypothetical protein [Leptolyngbya sp. FACHB-261]|uniref:hypothetical protein n=1 Tax=Leptolyngbya sp. FACHB-261 TaxID=2692806 RepID=UPI001688F06C|nr:hypothetical protein [Leptolyngbya sp. FACHB-261]MBD2100794.1 hypothetical protein [Leptolyngbya sp. FACHB-261]